jgi:hypothetical protein
VPRPGYIRFQFSTLNAQMTGKFSLIVTFCLLVSGCASSDRHGWSYKHVLVSVVDDKSGEPVRGAAVSATYMDPGNPNRPITDENGKAMLKVTSRPGVGGCWYAVEILNSLYDQHVVEAEEVKDLPTRSDDFIPTKPDVVLEVTSRASEHQRKEEAAAKDKAADAAAEKLFRDSPNFWPEHKNSWPKSEVGIKLIWKRWERASKQELGTKDDIDAIRAAVIQHMKNPKAQVQEIRWISPTAVMVKSSRYEGNQASAGYTYALMKSGTGWTVVAFYMDYVS